MMHHGGQKKIQFDNLKCLVMLGPQEVSLFKPIEGLSVPVVSCFKGHLKPCCKKNSTAKKCQGVWGDSIQITLQQLKSETKSDLKHHMLITMSYQSKMLQPFVICIWFLIVKTTTWQKQGTDIHHMRIICGLQLLFVDGKTTLVAALSDCNRICFSHEFENINITVQYITLQYGTAHYIPGRYIALHNITLHNATYIHAYN